MAYDFTYMKNEVRHTKEWLAQEYIRIRSGRATPALLDGISVEAYGGRLPLSQVAALGIESARTIRVSPYDAGQLKGIEKAIIDANLGVSVSSDDHGVRVSFPELTAERREVLGKLIRERLEEAKVRLRRVRDEVWDDLQKQEKDKALSTDDKFRHKDEMQKLIDTGTAELDALAERKRVEISN